MVLDSILIQLTDGPGSCLLLVHWFVVIVVPIQSTNSSGFNSYLFVVSLLQSSWQVVLDSIPNRLFLSLLQSSWWVVLDSIPNRLFYHCSNPADGWSWIQSLLTCFYHCSNPADGWSWIHFLFTLWLPHSSWQVVLDLIPIYFINTPIQLSGGPGI